MSETTVDLAPLLALRVDAAALGCADAGRGWPTPAEVHALYDRERAAERDVAESLAPFIIGPAAELADALSILSAAVSGVHAVGDVWDESPAAEAWFTDRMADEMVDRLRAEGVDDDEIAVQVAQLRTDVAE